MPSTRSHNIRTTLSYALDWLIVVVFLAISGALTVIEPFKRDFSVTDRTISFPYRKDTISIPVLFIIAVVAPAGIIAVLCIALVRLPHQIGPEPARRDVWKRKLWEVHAGWLGLALSLTLSLFLTQTMKNLFGKQRPDFLARCNPDVSAMNRYLVGGYTSELLEGSSQLVSAGICISKDGSGVGKSEYMDGFRSFPSGHCTIAFAGLTYLSFFLAAKLSVGVPFLHTPSREAMPLEKGRETAAAPPLYLLAITLVPFGAAIYIASTRFTDYKHHGFDVLFGSFEGLICAWLAFRYYHLPIRGGAGWAWAPRHTCSAFGAGMTVRGYGLGDGCKGKRCQNLNVERRFNGGPHATGVELQDMGTLATTGESYESHRALV